MQKLRNAFYLFSKQLVITIGMALCLPNSTFAGDKLTNPSIYHCIKKTNVCISAHSKTGNSSKIKSLIYFENAQVLVTKISDPKMTFALRDADGYVDFSLKVIHFSSPKQSITYDID